MLVTDAAVPCDQLISLGPDMPGQFRQPTFLAIIATQAISAVLYFDCDLTQGGRSPKRARLTPIRTLALQNTLKRVDDPINPIDDILVDVFEMRNACLRLLKFGAQRLILLAQYCRFRVAQHHRWLSLGRFFGRCCLRSP